MISDRTTKRDYSEQSLLSRRVVLFSGVTLPLAACATQSQRSGVATGGYTLVNALPAALPIVESGKDMYVKVRRFRSEVLAPYALPYGLLTPMDDATIASELAYLSQRIEVCRQVGVQFPIAFADNWRRFVETFPATLLERTDVYLLPGPRQIVGGAVRPSGRDRSAVLFGSDQIIDSFASSVSVSTLLHHELTHCCHIQSNSEMRQVVASFFQKNPGPPAKLYQMMWLEGLAGYVSKTLNPTATTLDVLTDAKLPEKVATNWTKVINGMLEKWDSTDVGLVDAYVGRGDSLRIPSRSAYYIGMLVAARLAEHRALPELTALKGDELRDSVAIATRALLAAGPPA
jgi:hypothetical protein